MRVLFVLALTLLPALALAQTYRWTDDQGRTQYTQVPPRDGRPYTTLGAPAPTINEPDALPEAVAPARTADAPPPAAAQRAEKTVPDPAKREEQCQQVREQLAYLDRTPAVRMRKDDAQKSRVTQDEHTQRRAELQKHLAEQCS